MISLALAQFAAALQQPTLLLWPHGGQRRARRNALREVRTIHDTAGRLSGADFAWHDVTSTPNDDAVARIPV